MNRVANICYLRVPTFSLNPHELFKINAEIPSERAARKFIEFLFCIKVGY